LLLILFISHWEKSVLKIFPIDWVLEKTKIYFKNQVNFYLNLKKEMPSQ